MINDTYDSMAVHVLAHLALANVRKRLWDESDIAEWLSDMPEPLQERVRDRLGDLKRN